MEIELYTHVDANFKSICKIWWYIKPTIKNVKKKKINVNVDI